jgi:tripeptide aminopeptidase
MNISEEIKNLINLDLEQRFLRYVQIDTQANPNHTGPKPSSQGQITLLRLLQEELQELKLEAVEYDPEGYVYATLPASNGLRTEPLTLLAHVDTAPDCSGSNVKPRVIRSYQGQDINYPDDQELILSPKGHPSLNSCIGDDLIVASGRTLLGTDDKAGVTEIMTLARVLIENPKIDHPEIRICFTTDEEIGQGVKNINKDRLSRYCLTLDAGEPGELEYECFDAWSFSILFSGISTHPGTAYNRMINAITAASAFLNELPFTERPETTKDRDGFYHPVEIHGDLQSATLRGIIRDFNSKKNEERLKKITEIALQLEKRWPGLKIKTEFKRQYRNMGEILKSETEFLDLCRHGIRAVGLEPIETPIRGGTDGALLSFEGFPCPNLASGQAAIHSKLEWTSIGRMSKCVETLIQICRLQSTSK